MTTLNEKVLSHLSTEVATLSHSSSVETITGITSALESACKTEQPIKTTIEPAPLDAAIATILPLLDVPSSFRFGEDDVDPGDIESRDAYHKIITPRLKLLATLLDIGRSHPSFDLRDQTNNVFYQTSRHCSSDDEWSSGDGVVIAQKILADLWSETTSESTLSFTRTILQDHIQPLFVASTAYSGSVDARTGRKSRPLHHTSLAPTMSSYQPNWKVQGLGVWNTLAELLEHTTSEGLEVLWHLLIPPIITMIEDSECSFKLRGTRLAHIVLEKSNSTLLKRTGIDIVLQRAFTLSFSSLSSPGSSPLLTQTFTTNLHLINLIYPSHTHTPSIQSFRQESLDTLLENAVLNVFAFTPIAPDKLEVTVYALRSLYTLVGVLGIRIVRNIKFLIPHISQILSTQLPTSQNLEMLSCATSTCTLLCQTATQRIEPWKHHMLTAAAKCWTAVLKYEGKSSTEQLKSDLCQLVKVLSENGSSTDWTGPADLLKLDASFHPLLQST